MKRFGLMLQNQHYFRNLRRNVSFEDFIALLSTQHTNCAAFAHVSYLKQKLIKRLKRECAACLVLDSFNKIAGENELHCIHMHQQLLMLLQRHCTHQP